MINAQIAQRNQLKKIKYGSSLKRHLLGKHTRNLKHKYGSFEQI